MINSILIVKSIVMDYIVMGKLVIVAIKGDCVKVYEIESGILVGKVDVADREIDTNYNYVTAFAYAKEGEVVMGTYNGFIFILTIIYDH